MTPPAKTVAYFGPAATFTQEALLTQPDLAECELDALGSITAVLEAVAQGTADLGFVPIENAIEGTVSATIDGLIHDVDLHIQREVVMDIHLHLLARPGSALSDIRVVSPRTRTRWRSARSTWHESCRTRSSGPPIPPRTRPGSSASPVVPMRRPSPRDWRPIATDWSSWPRTSRTTPRTRPGSSLVARTLVPQPTGHDKTSIVCFQRADHPGSLHGILGQFAARNINLTKLESRPTKQALGDYCFVIDLTGHVGDEIVADCLRDLHAGLFEPEVPRLVPGSGRARARAAPPGRRRVAGRRRLAAGTARLHRISRRRTEAASSLDRGVDSRRD